MKIFNLNNFTNGWFIGDFEPSILKKDYEIAVKKYKKGDFEQSHFHKESIEITVIAVGKVKMFDEIFKSGDIVYIDKNESTSFEVLEDTITVVFKDKSISGDKYLT